MRNYILLSGIIASLMLMGIATAQVAPPFINQQGLLNAAMWQASCKTNFTVSYVNDLISVGGFKQLQFLRNALQENTSRLQNYTTASNVTAYREFIPTYDSELATINTAIATDLSNASLTANQTATLKTDYSSLNGTYQSCELSALKAFGNAKVSYDNTLLNYYRQETTAVGMALGVNTTPLINLYINADNNFTIPLQSAVSNATNAAQLQAQINRYCLFDDCRAGTNFHFSAWFAITKDQIAYDQLIRAYPYASNPNLTIANGYIMNASKELTAYGTGVYPAQNSSVWNSIYAAEDLLRGVIISG